jgi:hypothetical protein
VSGGDDTVLTWVPLLLWAVAIGMVWWNTRQGLLHCHGLTPKGARYGAMAVAWAAALVTWFRP